MKSKFKIGDQVESKYYGIRGTVTAILPSFGEYPCIQVEHKAIFADFGPTYQQITRRGFEESTFVLTEVEQ